MKKALAIGISGLTALGLSFSAEALNFCYYLSGAAASPVVPITANGQTPVALAGLSAAQIAAGNCDDLWILNGNNGTPDAQVTGNVAAVEAFVRAGHTLSFADRNVSQGVSANTYIPGAGLVSFFVEFGTDIDVLNAASPVVNGPWGVITNTNLDGGNLSTHGYATAASLLAAGLSGLDMILSTGDATHVVDFTYSLGAGNVYYSTIPLDFYLAGAGNDPPATDMRNIYARNEAAFQALGNQQVPEPATLALLGLGLAGLGFARRRKTS